ncbi:uncharacterized protein LOC119274806 [Triticum dicoccoides]|uniref:uncharacterized protein LOC119274806 n=1 Tax=Triticum dicoccoides TaxID=85692 RepID=UPI00188EC8B5|nr:uncharacterized protein LOC119274806 [Triticum dicoccoides]
MTRHTTCRSTLGSPDPARILHHPPLSGDHQPACGWGAILQIEEASNFRWRRPQPAAGRVPWSGVAVILRHTGHLLSVGVKSEHAHPDPICSSTPSPPKAAQSRSSMQPWAIQ